MKQNDADALIAKYTAEYNRTTGKTIIVTHRGGWFRLTSAMGTSSTARTKEFVKMVKILTARPNHTETPEFRQKRLLGGSEMVYVGLSATNDAWETFQARPEDATPEVTGYIAVTQGFDNRAAANELTVELNALFGK